MLEGGYPRADREAGTADIAGLFDLAGRSHSSQTWIVRLGNPGAPPPTGVSLSGGTSIVRQERSGNIITVSSVVAKAPSDDGRCAPYRAAKGYRPSHAVSREGSRAIRIVKLHRTV